MAEPRHRAARPTGMSSRFGSRPLPSAVRPAFLPAFLPALLLCVILAGCGNQSPAQDEGSAAEGEAASRVGDCAADDPAVKAATRLTSADLDGDGTAEEVRLTGPEAPCPSVLFARVGDGFINTQLPTDAPPATSGFAVAVPKMTGQLVATRQDHPRGGFQIRVFALRDDELAELRSEQGTLLPFIATDTMSTPVSIDCAAGALVVTEAVAHEPRGVLFAWDVTRTTYAVQDGAVDAGDVQEIADNVLPEQLERRFPALAAHELFASCRAG